LPFDGKTILSSTEILDVQDIPSSLAIIGSGYIAMEMAHTFQKLGSKVTIIHRSPTILNKMDSKIGALMQKQLENFGVTFWKDTEVVSFQKLSRGVELHLRVADGKTASVAFDTVLSVVGRQPWTEGLGLENTGVQRDEKGYIIVNSECRTTDKNIFAIGDITNGPALAHRAMYMGKVAAEVASGKAAGFDATVVPGVIYSDPEIAWVGTQSVDAIRSGVQFIEGSFPFSASGRSLGANRPLGFAKIIADPVSHRILGGTIVGAHASDMITEISLAIEMGARLEDVAGTIHPHPTYNEAILEACEDALGKCVHLPLKKNK
ncbi:MAG: FAD-dependent oxidoreductase, partial [archaeon]